MKILSRSVLRSVGFHIRFKRFTHKYLTNRMWFSVACTLNDNDTRYHSSQNVVDSGGAAE